MNRQQLKLRFFDGQPPPAFLRHLWTDPANQQCPFYGINGNEDAVKHLCGVAYDALEDPYRDCGGSFVLVGPLSVAEDLVRRFAATLKLPLVEIQPWHVNSVNDVLVQIGSVLEDNWVDDPHLGRVVNIELTPTGNRIDVPPCILFANGLESFAPHVVHGLLAVLHHPERVMPTEVGWIVDAKSVCWAVAAASDVDGFATSLPVIRLGETSVANPVR